MERRADSRAALPARPPRPHPDGVRSHELWVGVLTRARDGSAGPTAGRVRSREIPRLPRSPSTGACGRGATGRGTQHRHHAQLGVGGQKPQPCEAGRAWRAVAQARQLPASPSAGKVPGSANWAAGATWRPPGERDWTGGVRRGGACPLRLTSKVRGPAGSRCAAGRAGGAEGGSLLVIP